MILNKGQLAEERRRHGNMKSEASENGVLGSEGDLSNHFNLTWSDSEEKEQEPIGLRIKRRKNQATKSAGWMPRHHTPTKDVVSCEKLRGTANKL